MGTLKNLVVLMLALVVSLWMATRPPARAAANAQPSLAPQIPSCTLHEGAACPPSVDGRLRWLRTRQAEGKLTGALASAVPVTARFAQPPTADDLARLRQIGEVSPWAADSLCLDHEALTPVVRAACADRRVFIVPLRVPWPNFERLLSLPGLLQIEADTGEDLLPPLDINVAEMHAAATWTVSNTLPGGLTGAGVTIADIDTGVDVFHPLLFRADGGDFAWLDRNGNGLFEPGLDMVDLNGNGEPDANEWLNVVEATSAQLDGYPRPYDVPGANDGIFQADADWLYNDANRSGQRDFGASFGDSAPSLGEQVFLVNDANGNRQLDPGETLIGLGSSKIARVLDVNGVTRQRGVDLSRTAADPFVHGTSVLGILAGGWPHISRYTGLAPDAELLLADPYNSGNSLSESLLWALANGADIVVHEYTHVSQEFFDGSSNHELLIAEAQRQGVVQVLPSGNINRGFKHTAVSLLPGQVTQMPFKQPSGNDPTAVDITLVWAGDPATLAATLTTPAGGPANTFTLAATGNSMLTADGHAIAGVRLQSSRGTARLDFHLLRNPLAAGAFTLTLTNTAGAPVMLSALVQDNRTAWVGGTEWVAPRSPALSVIWPATADAGIAVGSYSTRGFSGGLDPVTPGSLSVFSGQGPRVDGQPLLDLAAPSNYDVATASDRTQTGRWGEYRWFSGTSGAAPHVAGAAALLRQARPDLTAAQIETALRAGARRDSFTGSQASEAFGAGKVDVAGALRQVLPFAPLRAPRLAGPAPAPDGVMLPGEWDAAGHRQFPLAFLANTPQQGLLDLWLLASPGAGDRLLIAAQISGVQFTASDALWLWFGGGDVKSLSAAAGWQDWHWANGALVLDTAAHGRGAVSQTNAGLVFELGMPLAPADADDVQLTPLHDSLFAVAFGQSFTDAFGVARLAMGAWPADFYHGQWDKLGRLALAPPVSGDVSGDGIADVVDVQRIAQRWPGDSRDPAFDAVYDLDANGLIDLLDIQLIADSWAD